MSNYSIPNYRIGQLIKTARVLYKAHRNNCEANNEEYDDTLFVEYLHLKYTIHDMLKQRRIQRQNMTLAFMALAASAVEKNGGRITPQMVGGKLVDYYAPRN